MRLTVKLRQGDLGWIALAAGVIAIDCAVSDGETLSEAADRYLIHRPILTHAIALITVGHILNKIPARVDPYSIGFAWVRHALGRTSLVDTLIEDTAA